MRNIVTGDTKAQHAGIDAWSVDSVMYHLCSGAEHYGLAPTVVIRHTTRLHQQLRGMAMIYR